MNSRYKGIFFITLSALSFAFMNAFVRLSGDLPSVQKSFFRNLVAFFIALIMIIRSKDGFKIEKGNLKYMILRATFGTVGILCNFYAVDHLVLSDASMLNKMSPFFVIIFSFLLLKEKMSPAQALAVAGAFMVVENYGSKVRIFENSIPMSVRAAEISAEGVSIYEHDPNGKVASAYQSLTEEVLADE